jgi:acyl-CoA dehydrogenase
MVTASRAEPATGWLIGEENRGLACMFTMMNNARLAVGVQGRGCMRRRAYQKALSYALDRRQGKAPGVLLSEGMSAIALHPDVKRMLLGMQAPHAGGTRAICLFLRPRHRHARALPRPPRTRRYWSDRAGLLTPSPKPCRPTVGVESCVARCADPRRHGLHRGDRRGTAPLRDARIAPIYEGTNGIQAIDLVQRKLPLSGNGEHVFGYVGELDGIAIAVAAMNSEAYGRTALILEQALDDLQSVTRHLQKQLGDGRTDDALAGATPYLRLFSLVAGGAYLARAALADGDERRIALCRFFAENLLGETAALKDRITGGTASLAAAAKALISA